MKKLLLCSICALFLGAGFDATAASGTGLYGEPQKSIEAAQKYVKDRFFYSTREGDKADGKILTNTKEALNRVKENRRAYHEEVVSAAYAQANEELTSGAEEAKKTLSDLAAKAENAQTYDDKKAVGALIAKTSVQERAKRLSLDLELLELEAVSFVNAMPLNYIVARSPEQIEAEMAKDIQASKGGKEK